MSVVIPVHIFKAVQQFAAKADIRYYLNGVFVKAGRYIASTNGHIVMVVPFCTGDSDIIIPRIPPGMMRNGYVEVESGTTKVFNNGRCVYVSPEPLIDGKFPDLSRVVSPYGWSAGLFGEVDFSYLRTVIGKGVQWFSNNTQVLAMFTGNEIPRGTFAVIMKRRAEAVDPSLIAEIMS